jgi:hypothetical protein
MNLNANPTKEQLRELLARCDDLAGHHVLWVSREGEVTITRLPKVWPPAFEPGPEVQLYHETFPAGKEYVGPEAADEWVTELFEVLVEQWRMARDQPGVTSFHLFDGIGVVRVRGGRHADHGHV